MFLVHIFLFVRRGVVSLVGNNWIPKEIFTGKGIFTRLAYNKISYIATC